MTELRTHENTLSPGTLCPILHAMEADGLQLRDERKAGGRIRRDYACTAPGADVLQTAQEKADALLAELREQYPSQRRQRPRY